MPLVVVQARKKRRRRYPPWVLLLCVSLGALGLLTACDGPDGIGLPPTPTLCVTVPPLPAGPSPTPIPTLPPTAAPTPTALPPNSISFPPGGSTTPTPAIPDELARITHEEIAAAGGTMEAYLRQEEDAALLTRVAMAESSFSLEDRKYVMWIIRLRMEIAFIRPLASLGDKTTLKEEVFFPNQFTTIPAMSSVSDPRQAALGAPGDANACGGYINGAIYPCDTSGIAGVQPDPDNSNAEALHKWYETYNAAQLILAISSEAFPTSFPSDLQGFDSFLSRYSSGGTQFYSNGNRYFNMAPRDTDWIWSKLNSL